MLDMPSKDAAKVFIQWGKKYQSMFCRTFDRSIPRLNKIQATFYLQALWEITYSWWTNSRMLKSSSSAVARYTPTDRSYRWLKCQFPSLYIDLEFIFVQQRMGWDRNIGLNQYGDTWRIHRKICQQNFNQRAAVGYQPLIKSQVQTLLQGLLYSPDRLDEHTKKWVAHLCSFVMITNMG